MPLVLVDLEATRRVLQVILAVNSKVEMSEIIEIYSAVVDPTEFSILKEFHSYVCPEKSNSNSICSNF